MSQSIALVFLLSVPLVLQGTYNGYPGIKHIGKPSTLVPSLAASLMITIILEPDWLGLHRPHLDAIDDHSDQLQ